jgi:hypothetical protein
VEAYFYCTSYNNLRIKFSEKLDAPYGYNQYIRKNKGDYPITITNYGVYKELLDFNDIDEKDVTLKGLDKFYGYEDKFGKLNEKFLSGWDKFKPLTRYKVNKSHSENMFGIHMTAWETILVQWEGKFYLDGLTTSELGVLSDNTEGVLKRKVEKLLEVLNMEEEEIEAARETVTFYEKRMQYIIDDHREEILKEFEGVLYDLKEDKIIPHKINTGLDCGFLHVYSKNELYNEAKEVTVLYDGEADWMSIRLPYSPQSNSIKRKVFEKAKEVVNDFISEKLYCETVLD